MKTTYAENKEAQNCELRGRNLFKELINQFGIIDADITFTEDRYDPIDLTFILKGHKVAVEIKVRNEDAATFPTTFLEVKKCKAMQKRAAEENAVIKWYVNFFGDDLVYIYNIDRHWNDTVKELYTWKTHDYTNGKTMKYFYESPVSKALIYKRDESGKWFKLKDWKDTEYINAIFKS